MSYKYHTENIEGVRKLIGDKLWHVMYSKSYCSKTAIHIVKNQYDRITKKEAMYILKMLPKWRQKTLNNI